MVIAIDIPKIIECKNCGWKKAVWPRYCIGFFPNSFDDYPCDRCGEKTIILRSMSFYERIKNTFDKG